MIGIGGIGTTANTAQVRLAARVQTNALTANLLRVDLPVQVDVVNGEGIITDMCTQRDANGNFTATIAVTAPLLTMCVGGTNPDDAFAANGACNTNLTNKELVNVLNGGLKVSSSFALNALSSNGSVVLSKGQTATVGNNVQIGTAINNLMQATLATVLGNTLAQGQGSVTKSTLATGILNAEANVLADAISELDSSLGSLKTFVNALSPDVKGMLNGSLSSSVNNLLNSVGGLLTGLLTSVRNLLDNVIVTAACSFPPSGFNQCMLEHQLNGNQTSGAGTVSNVLLSILGLLEKALEPVLSGLGNQITSMLNNLLGADIGTVDVTLIDLDCGGGDNVKLVF